MKTEEQVIAEIVKLKDREEIRRMQAENATQSQNREAFENQRNRLRTDIMMLEWVLT